MRGLLKCQLAKGGDSLHFTQVPQEPAHHRAWRRSPREQPAMIRRFSGVTVRGHIALPLHTVGSCVCLSIQVIFCGSETY